MQLTTHCENNDDEETRCNSRQKKIITYGHRYRKKIVHNKSQDTVLEFEDDEENQSKLPDLVRDTDAKQRSNTSNNRDGLSPTAPESGNRFTITEKIVENKKRDGTSSLNFTSDDGARKQHTVEESSEVKKDKRKHSLPCDKKLKEHTPSDLLENKITKKKFSLPCDISEGVEIKDGRILDIISIKKKCSSTSSLPGSSSSKSSSSNTDGGIKKKQSAAEGFEGRCRLDSKVGEFMQEVISSISDIGHGNAGNGVKKLRGIIKKTLSYEKDDPTPNKIYIKRGEKCKNSVHFSEENITIEIPRTPQPYYKKIRSILCYYCCFGFLFPGS